VAWHLFAFQFALAAGANVFVTSGSPEKIERAMAMGAKGGVNYKEDGWDKSLKSISRRDSM
jgi:zinc-binding alcohol dehydrogenase/oxidoreductase